MAEKVIAVDLIIDSGESLSELKLVEDKLNLIEKSIKEVNSEDDKGLENQLKAMNQLVEDNNLSWNELSKTIEQYQSIALSAGKESPIGKEALKKAGELKSEMDNLSRSVNSLATNGQNLNTALQVSQGVVAGYTAVQSVTALVGEENEELVETLVKLQSAQGLLASIEQVRFALEKDSLIVLKTKTIWEKASAISTNLLAKANLFNVTATNTATVSTRVFTVALLAVPFVAIIAGLTYLVTNFDKVSDSIRGAIDWVGNLNENFNKLGVIFKSLLIPFMPVILAFKGLIMVLQELGVVETEAEKDIREANEKIIQGYVKRGEEIEELIIKHQQLTDTIVSDLDREIAVRKAQGKDVTKLEIEKLRILEESALKEMQLSKQRLQLFAQEVILRLRNRDITRGQYEEQVEQLEDLGAKLHQSVEAYKNAKNNIIVYQETITTNLRKESKKRADIRHKEREKEVSERENQLKEDKEWLVRYNEETQVLKDEQRAIEKENQIAQQMQDSLDSVQRHKDEAEAKKKVDLEYEENKKAIRKQGVESAEVAIQGLSNLNDLFLSSDLAKAGNNEVKKEQLRKQSFERNKKLQYVSAVVDGYKAVTSALAQPLDPISKAIYVGATVTASLAQLAKIKSTNYQSSGSVGSVTSSLGSSFSNVSSNNTQDDSQPTNTTTNVNDIIGNNNQNQVVLVVDDYNKVSNEQEKIELASSI